MMHWVFIMKYYHTSAMLPKIFHDIMIDDYVKEGKLRKKNTDSSDGQLSPKSGSNKLVKSGYENQVYSLEESLQTQSNVRTILSSTFGEYFDLSEYG